MDDLELVKRDLAALRAVKVGAELSGKWVAVAGISAAIEQKEEMLRALAAAGEL